jgi:hypothetical protein
MPRGPKGDAHPIAAAPRMRSGGCRVLSRPRPEKRTRWRCGRGCGRGTPRSQAAGRRYLRNMGSINGIDRTFWKATRPPGALGGFFYCDSLDQYRRRCLRREDAVMKTVLRVVGPLFCCCWAFLVRTRDRIALMAAQCCNARLRRGHHSRRLRPCLVRMAVGARAHLG